MDVADVYYVGGFGVMGWVTASDYNNAQPDPLVDHANGIMQHMNSHHAGALTELARAFAGIDSDEVTMTSVDRLGFYVRFKTPEGMRGARIAFSRQASNPEETRQIVVEMVAEARKK
jgi:putative heme iron utilization protein